MDRNNLESLWYPDFEGIAYIEDQDSLIICPYFLERGKALFVSEKIKAWNENFINITFIEVKNNEYEFVCYENLQASREPITFGLYRSGMNQNGGYRKFKDSLQKNPRLQILFMENPSTQEAEPIGSSLKVKKVECISEDDLRYNVMPSEMDLDYPYYWENIAHLFLTRCM